MQMPARTSRRWQTGRGWYKRALCCDGDCGMLFAPYWGVGQQLLSTNWFFSHQSSGNHNLLCEANQLSNVGSLEENKQEILSVTNKAHLWAESGIWYWFITSDQTGDMNAYGSTLMSISFALQMLKNSSIRLILCFTVASGLTVKKKSLNYGSFLLRNTKQPFKWMRENYYALTYAHEVFLSKNH